MTKRIIINVDEGIDPERAIGMVFQVMGMGRVSKNGKQYCYVSTFSGGHVVYSNVTKNGSDVFFVAMDRSDADDGRD